MTDFARRFRPTRQTHARRVCGAGVVSETAAAKLIPTRIRKGDLSDESSARDLRRKDWSGLTDNDRIKAGRELLVDFEWISPKTIETTGRPWITDEFNPRALQ